MPTNTRAGGGVAGYVTGKNAAEMEPQRAREERKAKLVALKHDPLKNSVPANRPAPWAQSTGTSTHPNGTEDVQQSRPPFGTNGSSINKSSSSGQTGQVQPPNWHGIAQGQPNDDVYGREGEAASLGVEPAAAGDEEVYGSDFDRPANPLGKNRRTHAQELESTNHNNGQFPDMPGDSYPETTDGPDAGDSQDIHEHAHAQYENHQATRLPTRGTGTRVSLSQNIQAYPGQQQQPTQQAQDHRQPALNEPPPTNVDSLMTGINRSFLWGKATGSQSLTQPQSASDQAGNARSSTAAAPTNGGQDGSVREGPSGLPPAEHQLAMPTNRPRTPRQHGRQPTSKPKPRHESAAGIPTEQAGDVRAAQQPDLQNHVKHQMNMGPPPQPTLQQHRQQIRKQQPQQHSRQLQHPQYQLQPLVPQRTKPRSQHHGPQMEDEVQLDYERDDLFEKEYDELKGQSFDVDPNAAPFSKFAKGTIVDDLQKKLAAVRHMPYDDQQDFFTSLDIDTWEDAGDWFLEQFGVLTKQLKENRRGKRKAAQAFEEEISERYLAVSKKFKLTDDALNEMKESGGKVLQSTPSKSKKSK